MNPANPKYTNPGHDAATVTTSFTALHTASDLEFPSASTARSADSCKMPNHAAHERP